MTLNGFAVVRLPHLNYLVPECDVIPHARGMYYAGVTRHGWADVFDEDFYAERMPPEIARLAIAIKAKNNDFTGIDLCQDEQVALDLLAYANRDSVKNELIAVRSPLLDATKGCIESDFQVEWLGFDFVALGDWSLISAGMFYFPERYSEWFDRANRIGLFDDPSLLAEYVQAYERDADAGYSEPIAPASAGLGRFAIEVGRLRATS
jgi:hypothetical protein